MLNKESRMLNQEVINIIKSTVPILEENGTLLTKHFYQKLFQNNPDMMPFFNKANQDKGTQQEALASAICAYAKNIDNIDALGNAVELISHKHFSLKVKPEHYPIVGVNLIESIKDILGKAATPEIVDAWSKAYFFLADILIEAEKSLTDTKASYEGFKKFKVVDKVKESETITSFYLSPKYGELPSYSPGQYLTIRVPFDGATTMRNYSLSSYGNKKHLRISVKREDKKDQDIPAGFVSNFLHKSINQGDELEVGAPAGVFNMSSEIQCQNVVFIAGGIGVTPLLSMAYSLVSNKEYSNGINFIHANQSEEVHAFAKEIKKIDLENDNFEATFFYEMLEREMSSNELMGYVSKEFLKKLVNDQESVFYVCGPKKFMSKVVTDLEDLGVSDDSINFEFFGPLESF